MLSTREIATTMKSDSSDAFRISSEANAAGSSRQRYGKKHLVGETAEVRALEKAISLAVL